MGDRMKIYERASHTVLPRRTYTIIRVDGRAFHTYLRDAARPYDVGFMADMDAVAVALCEEVSGAVLAYVQSDEVSVIAADFRSHGTEPWFGGEVQKMCSVAASTATAALSARRGAGPTFDARVFTIADPVEVGNYLIWRQRDAVRNSIAMAAQVHFTHRQLHKVSTGQMQEMLWAQHGINWGSYPDGCRRGRVVVRETGERAVTYVDRRTQVEHSTTALRSWWEVRPAPHLTLNAGEFLATTIPVMAPLGGD